MSARWWLPTAVLSTRSVQAHLLPPGADGSRGAAVCGEGRSGWMPVDPAGVRSFCHACQVRGGVRPVGEDTVGESRAAALVAAGWCAREGLGAEELRDLLDALLEHPAEARRTS